MICKYHRPRAPPTTAACARLTGEREQARIKMASGNIGEIQPYMFEPQSDPDSDEESVVHQNRQRCYTVFILSLRNYIPEVQSKSVPTCSRLRMLWRSHWVRWRSQVSLPAFAYSTVIGFRISDVPNQACLGYIWISNFSEMHSCLPPSVEECENNNIRRTQGPMLSAIIFFGCLLLPCVFQCTDQV